MKEKEEAPTGAGLILIKFRVTRCCESSFKRQERRGEGLPNGMTNWIHPFGHSCSGATPYIHAERYGPSGRIQPVAPCLQRDCLHIMHVAYLCRCVTRCADLFRLDGMDFWRCPVVNHANVLDAGINEGSTIKIRFISGKGWRMTLI